MSNRPIPPFLQSFGRDLLALVAVFLLPRIRRRTLWCAFGQLVGAAALALATAALLVGSCALLADRLLGTARRELAFPYLGALLAWAGRGHHLPLLAGVALLGGLALWILGGGLASSLRRRWWALAGLLTLLVVATAVDVAFTEGNGAVMEALNRRSAASFWGTAAGLTGIYLLTLPIQFLNSYGQQRWALAWRRSSTVELQQAYLSGQSYYQLQADPALSERIDNPDQRLADDAALAVNGATNLFFGFCASLLALGAYILVLFQISGWLVLSLAVATLLGNGVILRLVRRLGALGFRQQALEADYRYALVHVRSHAESLAFLRGEAAVGQGLGRRLGALLANFERLIRWRALVEQSSGLYAFLMQFVPYLVLSSAYFSGRVSLGDLTVGSIAFGQVQASLSFLIDRAEAVSGLFASLRRIADLKMVLLGMPAAVMGSQAEESQASGTTLESSPSSSTSLAKASPGLLTFSEPPVLPMASLPLQRPGAPPARPPTAWASPGQADLRLVDLAVAHPGGGRPLLEGLDLALEAGQRLLITGPSGSGKTSLLRVLCGLVPAAAGRLQLPSPERILALPQQPFLPLGSLRDQILFPAIADASATGDRELRQLMAQVGLVALAERHPDLGQEEDWARVLSGGEQQRLGFARLLLRRPALVFLDEASSALDLQAEDALYGLLVAAVPTLVSVGHRPSLRAFHHWELVLEGGGGWRLVRIRPAA
jgi:putative ATP-binding cassette transporter